MRSLLLLHLFAAAAAAQMHTQKIEYKDGDTVLVGVLVSDPERFGERPGVLVVHQWTGITDHEITQAKKLARLGYAAFCVDIYGKTTRPKGFQEAGKFAGKYKNDRALFRRRLMAGLKTLLAQKQVKKSQIGAIGFCFGGTGVLELARSGADVKGIVSFHGGLDSPTPADAKKITGKVLVLHGADDPHVPAKEVAAFQKEMRDAKVDWQFVAYGGAVHSFTQPGANHETAKYHEPSARRSWLAMKNFFAEIFK